MYTYLGFGIDKVDKDEFDEDPKSVEEGQVPVLGKVVPRDGVGLTAHGENSLNSDVHDHETLGTKGIWQNLESVGNEQTGPGKGIEDTKEPHKGNLCVSGTLVRLV